MESPTLFVREFRKSDRRVKRRIKAYISEPENEKTVHDVRTSLRRMEALFLLMPKKMRRRNRRLINRYKQFFRANSNIRDYDIIRTRLVAWKHNASRTELLADLGKKRESNARRARDMAGIISALPEASLDELEEFELESRMDKVVSRLLKKIRTELPIVLSDSRNIDELHQLRKDLKKLRYVLDIIPSSIKEPYETKIFKILKGKRVEERLEELQDTLGAIHDIDVTVKYLSTFQKEVVAPIVEGERVERDRLFCRFADDFHKRSIYSY